MQGFESHSLASLAQLTPKYPATQTQVNALASSLQGPPFWHGLEPHSSSSVPHSSPLKPEEQVQLYDTPSEHVPPFWHGLEAHHSVGVAQLVPVQPGSQVQV